MKQSTARKIAAAISILLAALMIFGLVSNVVYLHAAAAKKSVSSLKKDLASIASEKKEIAAEIDRLNSQISTTIAKKDALDKKINATEKEISITNELIEGLEEDISVKTVELDAAIAKMEKQDDLFKKRARTMYESGETTYLEVLLTAGDFSQMISRMEKIRQIMSYDDKLLNEYTATKAAVAQQKAELESDKADQEKYKTDLVKKKQSLDEQQKESKKLLDSLSADKAKSKSELDALDKEENDIAAEIKRLNDEAKKAAEAAKKAGKPVKDFSSQTFLWPLPGHRTLTSPYGNRKHPITGVYKLHTGQDISAPKGTTIVAAKSGTVVKSTKTNAYGNYVVINHGGGMMTAYAHMSQRLVSAGQEVKQGQTIGKVGSTGYSTGNHLHFEVIINGSFVNPMKYFS